MSTATTPPAPAPPKPRAENPSIGELFQRKLTDICSGELGSRRFTVGRIASATVFESRNDRVLTAGNFVNLIVQSAAYTTIAMGVVWVLLLGEIDLASGYVSGVAGVITAVLLLPDASQSSTVVAIALALGAGIAIGLLHGVIITKIGIPSFVVTLAGLLA